MKLLLKIALTLAIVFASTFIVIKMSGLLTVDDIKQGFENLRNGPMLMIGLLVVVLLFSDLFIAVPTMTVIMLSGYFLGFSTAMLFSFTGVALAALTGYLLSRRFGDMLLQKVEPNAKNRQQTYELFQRHGMWVLILSRAMPILPEVSACLAGTCKMRFAKFLFGWSIGTIPYLVIVTYVGSISSVHKPMPAIMTAIVVTSILWAGWLLLSRHAKKARLKDN
ncbi:MAG: VTT domain-containing protein [Gammaproteobacteria bacterium]|nr:VTT domain-containing protein [Gammaproteobacteria bacterium]